MHAENILALLNATRCECCGRAAVPGVTMCLACAIGSRATAIPAAGAAEPVISPAGPSAVKPVMGSLV